VRLAAAALTAVFALSVLWLTDQGTAFASAACDERALYDSTNGSRSASGLGGLFYDTAASNVARDWSLRMASSGSLAHNPNLASDVSTRVTNDWTRLGENVGVGYSISSLHSAFMNSSAHRANILGDFNRAGVGVAYDSTGRIWVTVVFVKAPWVPHDALPCSAPPPPATTPLSWYLRNANSAGSPSTSLGYGMNYDSAVTGDWDGNGVDTVGIYEYGMWYLRNANSAGSPSMSIQYGYASAIPVVGDWDGDGDDTIGVYDGGNWYLRNSNSPGRPDIVISYGYAGALPVVGDWDGDGVDTIGVYDGGNWYLRNTNKGGYPDIVVSYGYRGAAPLAGDWDGDGIDSIAVFDKGVWMLRNTNRGGYPDASFSYGVSGYRPTRGDWDGNGVDTIGVSV
jgi:hypothetical protein